MLRVCFKSGACDQDIKQKVNPGRTLSMNHWKDWAAFHKLNSIHRNSKRPKGVITAALGTSSDFIGI